MTAGNRRIAFVTGKLAEQALREMVHRLGEQLSFEPVVIVAKISVAALITVKWLHGKITVPIDVERVVLPGWCTGDILELSTEWGVPVERGPRDLRQLPTYFQRPSESPDLSSHRLEIIAEINHANRQTIQQLEQQARQWVDDGADRIDLGCTPGEPWDDIGIATRHLIQSGFRVSVDSFDANEVTAAVHAGASLVFSVNRQNCHLAADWNTEVVVIPDSPSDENWLDNLKETADILRQSGVRYRIDPVLEPIGFGFARSLFRYGVAREAFPDTPLLMGVGNLTELTAVDSAGVNALLAGFCTELNIDSVLTTQVANWTQSSVRELAVARSLMFHAVKHRVVPKRIDDRLVMLRDPTRLTADDNDLQRLASLIRDRNFRIFADGHNITVINSELSLGDTDPFHLFAQLGVTDPSHAFYLGWEFMKATLANQLGKQYVQDEALAWGLLSVKEESHRAGRQASANDHPQENQT